MYHTTTHSCEVAMRGAIRARLAVVLAVVAVSTVFTGAYMYGSTFMASSPPHAAFSLPGSWRPDRPSEHAANELWPLNSSLYSATAMHGKPRHRLCAMSRSFNHAALLAQWVRSIASSPGAQD